MFLHWEKINPSRRDRERERKRTTGAAGALPLTEYNHLYSMATHVPVPDELNDYEILAKLVVASYYHTDAIAYAGDLKSPPPLCPSHEGTGTVTLGRKSRGSRLEIVSSVRVVFVQTTTVTPIQTLNRAFVSTVKT